MVVAQRHVEQLFEALVLRAFAKNGRDGVIDDPVIERVARDADAGKAERIGMDAAGRGLEPDDGKIARAAAEIAHKHGRGGFLLMRVEVGGGDGLHHMVDFFEAEPAEGCLVALLGQRRIRVRPGEFDRPAKDEPGRQASGIGPRMRSGAFEKGRQDIFEIIPLSIDPRVLERGAGGVGLERLEEARIHREVDKGFDCPRAGLAAGLRARFIGVLPKAQYGAECGEIGAAMPEPGRLHAAVRLPQGQHRVGRAKIDTDGRIHIMAQSTYSWI